MKNKLSAAISAAIPFILLSTPIHTTQADSVKLTELGGLELSITANRRAQPVDKTLAPVTIISREDIDRSQATELTDVLRKVPGLTIKNSGGLGKATSVSIRGTSSRHLLMLVDGIMIGSATLGYAAFEDISLNNVERVEIVRGPRSALYGSEAIGGVIQIITRRGKKGFHPEFSISAGSNNTFKSSANFSGGNNNNWYNLNVGSQKSTGIDAENGTAHTELDRDGYRREEVSLNVGHNYINGATAELRLQKSLGDKENDGSPSDFTKFHHEVLGAKITTPLGVKKKLTFQVGQSKDDTDNYKTGAFVNIFNTKRHTVSVLFDSSVGVTGNIVTGLDWQKDFIEVTGNYAKKTKKNAGIFAAYQNRIGKADFDFSLRQDDNAQFGNKTTGGVAFGYALGAGFRFRTAYGTAFKAPTFNDLYHPFGGNPNLRAESSKNIEIGLQAKTILGSWEVNAHKNEIDDLIAWAPVPGGGGIWAPSNVNKATVKGIEARYQTTMKSWNIDTSFSLLDTKNADEKTLRYRPTKTLNVDIDRKFGRWSVGSSLHAESTRFTDVANTDELKGFATLDLRTQYDLNKDWSVGAKINNVLDKTYETNKQYNQDGINGMLTLKYSPK